MDYNHLNQKDKDIVKTIFQLKKSTPKLPQNQNLLVSPDKKDKSKIFQLK